MNGMSGNGDYASTLGPEFNDPNNPLSKRTIYFMLDSSEVMPDFVPVIAAHAHYLIANPVQRITLEGHGDERGSREYNIALGEQRAKSVAGMMKVQGVSENQLEIVSYGEEKPSAFGSDEAAWEKNRRVEIVYQARQINEKHKLVYIAVCLQQCSCRIAACCRQLILSAIGNSRQSGQLTINQYLV